MKKICVVTGSRAEYGLLRNLMQEIESSPNLKLATAITGTHLSLRHGNTENEISDDGIEINKRVEMLIDGDDAVSVTKSLGLATISFADVMRDLDPDLVVLLGDRYELLAPATSCLLASIPIAHIHGGEITEGAVDDSIRHAITKMSHIHFVSKEAHRQRVIQMGENPDMVFNFGGLGAAALDSLPKLSKAEIEKETRFVFQNQNLLITFHPVTLEQNSEEQLNELLSALENFEEFGLIFTLPNADVEGQALRSLIDDFCKSNPFAKAFDSLGSVVYTSTMAQVDAVVGNSSSGILEAPSLGKPSINIGNRQKGRESAESVIHVEPISKEIVRGLKKAISPDFQTYASQVKNQYHREGTVKNIAEALEKITISPDLLKKKFVDFDAYRN